MRKNNCEVIRRELDELMLDDTCSSSAVEHLRDCAACREFQEKQTKLRQIVGSLGTVAAPADFDFRLRARLANESSSTGFHLKSVYWTVARQGLAVAALLIVIATGVVLVRNAMNQNAGVGEVVTRDQSPPPPREVEPSPKSVETPFVHQNPEQKLTAGVTDKRSQPIKNERPARTGSKSLRPLVTEDFSNERAEVITGMEPFGASEAFPIDASLQSFKVSLDDGRGNARTISVPTISFGSQRIVQNGNQFVPKRVW